MVVGAVPAGKLTGQDFIPPATGEPSKTQIGLYGFSTRLGWDFKDGGATIIGLALDLGHVGFSQVRLRPSAEIGFAEDVDTYVVNAEVLYRFSPDTEKAVPYVGMGLGLAGRDDCEFALQSCPEVWLQFALGFELTFRDNLSWIFEYHAEDALRRHRLFLGLTSRRGS
jgi:hypothetical protein